jgi:eukaryotic-like serine/threonine-protein kinase
MTEAFARRYRLLERIAIGGTAEVFRAQFLTGDGGERPVVIKRVLPQFARDERFRRLFHEEACVAVTMSHPSIVRVLDHGDIGQTCYIALELVDGKDLGGLLGLARGAGQRVTPELATYVACQVADALQFIHDQTSSEGTPLQIIHRDVSPQNILVSYTGDVKLTDFGIAKSAIRRERTVDGTLRGKLDYMSPEQVTLGEVDRRADVFALGCVLYEMLDGEPPFRGASEIETLERVRSGTMRARPEALAVPLALQRILARALEPARDARYQTAGEMAADLHAFLADHPTMTAAELGRWTQGLVAQGAEVGPDRVDEAVRQLLGESADEPITVTQPASTTVFADTPSRRADPAATRAGERGSKRPLLALVIIAAIGLCGWGLWGLHMLRQRTGSTTSSPTDARADLARREREAAPSLPAEAELAILSSPPGALVLLDGRSVGRTPLRLPRPSSAFTLELRKEGFRSWRRPFAADAAPHEVSATLLATAPPPAAGTAQMTINSLPWSRVRIDGRIVGNTPLIKWVVRAGNHRVELLGSEGAVRRSLSVTLRRGESRSFTFDLTKREP